MELFVWEKNEEIIAKKKFPSKKVTYIPNGVNLEVFKKEKDFNFFKDIFSIPKNKKVLLYQSRIDIQKNQSFLIDVALSFKSLGRLDEYHFLIVAPVMNEDYLRKMENRIESEGLSSYFSFKLE